LKEDENLHKPVIADKSRELAEVHRRKMEQRLEMENKPHDMADRLVHQKKIQESYFQNLSLI
jgi:hypothetical protein